MQRYSLGPVLLMAASVLVLTHCEQGITLGSETDDLSVSMGAPKEQVYIRFTGDEEHGISLDEAEQKIEAFQNNNPFESHAWYFSAQSIKMILAQNACVGIRIYAPSHKFSASKLVRQHDRYVHNSEYLLLK